MAKSYRFVTAMGALAALALAIPACGSDDDDSGSGGGTATGGTAGTGGGATGGAGGASGGAGGATGGAGGATGGAGGAVTCGGASCSAYNVGGLLPVAACCSTNDKCGAEVDATIAGLLGGIPTGCYEAEQTGDVDCACPGYTFKNPLPPMDDITFPGCCTPAGKCGYFMDISSQQGPNIGCQEATWGDGMGKTCTAGSPDLSCLGDGGASDAAAD